MKSGLTVRSDSAQSILDALKTLANKDVLVGIPESKDERDDGDIGNAAIGYINENGSPAQNIPPRPHLQPGVRAVEQDFMPHLKSAARKALEGDTEGAVTSLDRAGTVAANGVKRYITITGFTPLADATIANRLRRGRTGNKPLIDTGEYRRSITHVVRDKDADS
ncbi:hypothetical protein [Pantoea agglomerans]|uniref:Uncharacterized protein n=1 Tax=Enterobacter agglomerans TaxID=549 RepID=A0ACC5PWE0_ENTAG|nr:hypothetical protein [Pantoea agglomerans]MBD8129047.1 hypothetical protein [Pantoea agglomerans]MBD8154994.1 hypothetical protein [Pantoea agglomerans]